MLLMLLDHFRVAFSRRGLAGPSMYPKGPLKTSVMFTGVEVCTFGSSPQLQVSGLWSERPGASVAPAACIALPGGFRAGGRL